MPPPKFKRLTIGGEVRLMGAYIVKCTGVEKNADGSIAAIHCTADLETGNGNPADGRKVKGTIHWVSNRTMYKLIFLHLHRDRLHLQYKKRQVLFSLETGKRYSSALKKRTGIWRFYADGAMRDALSILDTCAGVTAKIDADVVRRMAGVTDRSYLFHISDALEAQDGAAALAQLAALRQQSVDVKRLTEELIAHYRALMLAALPGGQSLLSGVSPEEEQQ